MASCDELFNLALGDDPQEEDYSEPINHTFIKDSTDTGYFVCHYNAQNIFTYKNFKKCYYQIEFTFTTPRKFSLYSRTKESTAIIDTIASGTFTGDPLKAGNVNLTVSEGSISF